MGSTGSIGRQTLEVAAHLGIRVHALAAAGNDIELLARQVKAFMPQIVSVADGGAAKRLEAALKAGSGGIEKIEIMCGADGLIAAASQSAADTTVAAVSGAAGLPAVIAAVKAGKNIALANKEALVTAGRIVTGLAKGRNVRILPVDSEHSAIFQCLQGTCSSDVKRLIITGTGGPFREAETALLASVTPEQALAHPIWRMGKKISVDSATLANKGLEVIEAAWLFDMAPERIDVLIHPQGIVHSMIELRDGAVMAQMGEPDMRSPIQYALTYPERREGLTAGLSLAAAGKLTFEAPDFGRFPCLALAYAALRTGGTAPAAYNAANEAAVGLFLNKAIGFMDIPRLVGHVLDKYEALTDTSIENIYATDREARALVYAASASR